MDELSKLGESLVVEEREVCVGVVWKTKNGTRKLELGGRQGLEFCGRRGKDG